MVQPILSPTPLNSTTPQILKDISVLSSMSPQGLRRWFVESVLLSPENQSILKNTDTPPSLLSMALGNGPSSEHIGISARLIYEYLDDRTAILSALPTPDNPKAWNQASHMTQLLLWVFMPWKDFRYDPRSETVQVALSTGQWAFHLKGTDSEDVMTNKIIRMLDGMRTIGFTGLYSHLVEQGLASFDPADYNLEASEFATALQACESHLYKFSNRTSALKETLQQIRREPLMLFDTSTANSVTGLAAFGNGVVPTDDIFDHTEGGDFLIHPAGKLLSPNQEFVLSTATGLAWPESDKFSDLMDLRAAIHHETIEGSWDDWMDVALTYSDALLTHKAPTYKSFLDHAFQINPDTPPEERDAFLRLLGAAVFGSNLKIVAAIIGAPNAGKDTVIKWLSMILGQNQVGVLSPTALTANADDQRAFAPLKGARVAVVSGEVGEGRNSALLAEKIKSITSGGGTMTVAEKYEKPTTIFFDGMLVLQGNSVPQIQGGDKALYRNRLVAVEFKHPFPLQANSYEREYRREAPFFLQVLFVHYLNYVEKGGGMQGIDPPQSWRSFGEQLEFSADSLAVIDRCLTQPNPSIQIPSTVFYKALSILAEKHLGLRYPISPQRWSARLRRAGVDLTRDRITDWRSRVDRADYKGWMMHFTLDAHDADGIFSQKDWTNALELANVSINN